MADTSYSRVNCIFCDKPARSREHVFPAALGGRRVDRGIFCADHNNAMAPQAAALSQQLAYFNALLGVKSDHTGEDRPYYQADPETGIEFVTSDGYVSVAQPTIVSEEQTETGKLVGMVFKDQQQHDEWQARLKAGDADIQALPRTPCDKVFSTDFRVKITLGGADGLRAVAYVGLTYLAHLHPDLVRHPALEQFLRYVRDGAGDGFAWWEEDTLSPDGYGPSFEFQYRIAISMDAATGVLSGHIDILSAFSFGIRFGSIPDRPSFTDIVDINPLVDEPPGDRKVRNLPGTTLFTYVSSAGNTKLTKNIEDGKAAMRLAQLMANIDAWYWDRDAKDFVEVINMVVAYPRAEWPQRIEAALDVRSQRVRQVLRKLALSIKQLPPRDPLGTAMLDHFLLVVQEGAEPRFPGMAITPLYRFAILVLTREIEGFLTRNGCVTETDLRNLFLDHQGYRLVGTYMFEAAMKGIPG